MIGERERPGFRSGRTHQVVSADRSPVTLVEADDRLIEAACGVADEAILEAASSDIGGLAPHTQRILEESFEPISEAAKTYYRIELPEGRAALIEALSVDETTEPSRLGEARWRLWEITSLTLFRGGEWCYRSVPHHERIWVDSDVAPELPDRADELLSDRRCGLVPAEPVLTWANGKLGYETLADGDRYGQLRDLQHAAIDRDDRVLRLDWRTLRERSRDVSNPLLRGVTRLSVTALSALTSVDDVPERLTFADDRSLDAFVDALETIREDVGYSFGIAAE